MITPKENKNKASSAGPVAVFAVTFVLLLSGAGLLISTYFPPRVWNFLDKKRVYHDNAAKINTVFIGTSLIFHQIDSLLFDKVMSVQGCQSYSFNFGYGAGTLLEVNSTLNEISNYSDRHNIRLIIEPQFAKLRAENINSNRFLESLTFQNLPLLSAEIDEIQSSDTENNSRWFSLLTSYWISITKKVLIRNFRIGFASKTFFNNQPIGIDRNRVKYIKAYRGFSYLDSMKSNYSAKHHKDFTESEIYQKWGDTISRLSAYKKKDNTRISVLSYLDFRSISPQVRNFSTVYLILPPQLIRRWPDRVEWRSKPKRMNFNVVSFDYGSTPELYAKHLWFDKWHMNKMGAEKMTAMLARSVCAFERSQAR